MMDISIVQKDYMEDTITVLYEGEYDPITLSEEIQKNYEVDLSNLIPAQIVEHTLPYEYKGFENKGTVVIQL